MAHFSLLWLESSCVSYLGLQIDAVTLLTVGVSLSTILSAASLLRSFQSPRIRTLTVILGLVGLMEGFRVIHAKLNLLPAGVIVFDDFLELLAAVVCLVAVVTLGLLGREHNNTTIHLRLFEADEKPAPAARIPFRYRVPPPTSHSRCTSP